MNPHAKAEVTEEAEILEMISEGGPIKPSETATERAKRRWPGRGARLSAAPLGFGAAKTGPAHWFGRQLDRVSERLGRGYLELLGRGGRLSGRVRGAPKRMHKVADQTQLVVELIDDVRDGTYRDLSWRSVAIASAGLLYSVSPADVIPEFVPLLGALDDMVVMAVTTRWIERDLRAYCRFKGYPESSYF